MLSCQKQLNLSKPNLIGTNFCVWNRQVFGLFKIQVYSVYSLDWFHYLCAYINILNIKYLMMEPLVLALFLQVSPVRQNFILNIISFPYKGTIKISTQLSLQFLQNDFFFTPLCNSKFYLCLTCLVYF